MDPNDSPLRGIRQKLVFRKTGALKNSKRNHHNKNNEGHGADVPNSLPKSYPPYSASGGRNNSGGPTSSGGYGSESSAGAKDNGSRGRSVSSSTNSAHNNPNNMNNYYNNPNNMSLASIFDRPIPNMSSLPRGSNNPNRKTQRIRPRTTVERDERAERNTPLSRDRDRNMNSNSYEALAMKRDRMLEREGSEKRLGSSRSSRVLDNDSHSLNSRDRDESQPSRGKTAPGRARERRPRDRGKDTITSEGASGSDSNSQSNRNGGLKEGEDPKFISSKLRNLKLRKGGASRGGGSRATSAQTSRSRSSHGRPEGARVSSAPINSSGTGSLHPPRSQPGSPSLGTGDQSPGRDI